MGIILIGSQGDNQTVFSHTHEDMNENNFSRQEMYLIWSWIILSSEIHMSARLQNMNNCQTCAED